MLVAISFPSAEKNAIQVCTSKPANRLTSMATLNSLRSAALHRNVSAKGRCAPGKWNLYSSSIDYIHSSAKYYLSGEDGSYIVTDVKDVD